MCKCQLQFPSVFCTQSSTLSFVNFIVINKVTRYVLATMWKSTPELKVNLFEHFLILKTLKLMWKMTRNCHGVIRDYIIAPYMKSLNTCTWSRWNLILNIIFPGLAYRSTLPKGERIKVQFIQISQILFIGAVVICNVRWVLNAD